MTIDFAPPPQERAIPAPVRLPLALGLGLLATVLGAVCWALVGYFGQRISLAVAVVIGVGVSLAYAAPLRPVSRLKSVLLFLPVTASTLASVLLGEYVVAVLLVRRELGCTLLDSAALVALNPQVLNTSDTVVAVFLGLLGAILGFVGLLRQRP